MVIPANIRSLDEAIEAGALHDNLQTRMLSGLPLPFDEVTDEMLELAKRNVSDNIALVGISERMDESLMLAKRRLGFYDILAETGHRVNASRPRGKDIPADLRAAAERSNEYDTELYRFATEQFDNAREREGLDFDVELAALKAARVTDGVPPELPAPERFGGTDEDWALLVGRQVGLLGLRSTVSRGVVRTMRLS